MNRTLKTFTFIPLAAVTIGAPVALAASCGDEATQLNVVAQNAAILLNTSEDSFPANAWKSIVERYNSLPTTTVKATLTFKNTVDNIGTAISSSISARDNWNYNLIYAYPSSIASLAARNAWLPLAESIAEETRMRSLFTDRIVAANDNISGLQSGNFYILPLAKSSELIAINKPLAAHLFAVAKNNGYFADTNTAEIDRIINEQTAIENGDFAYLQSADSPWQVKTDLTQGTKQFDDRIFTDAKLLIDFSISVRGLFGIKSVANVASAGTLAERDFNVLGIDSATNFVYSKSMTLAKGKSEDFLFGKSAKEDQTYFDYKFINDPNSQQRKNFNAIYDEIIRGIQNKAVYVKNSSKTNSASYSSNALRSNHALAFAIGSTAGYAQNYVAPDLAPNAQGYDAAKNARTLNELELEVKPSPGQWGAESNLAASVLQGPSLMALRGTAQGNTEAQKFVKWLIEARLSWPAITMKAGQRSYNVAATVENISPAERFGHMGGYVWSTKEALAKDLSNSPYYNPGQKLVAENIKRAAENAQDFTLIDDPVDVYSGTVRDGIEAAIAEQSRQFFEASKASETSNDVISKLRLIFGT